MFCATVVVGQSLQLRPLVSNVVVAMLAIAQGGGTALRAIDLNVLTALNSDRI